FGFGAACGGLFGGLVRGRVVPRRPAVEGVAYAGVVWAASYLGWVPALGILPLPPLDRPGRAVAVAAAHGVYGALLGLLTPAATSVGRPGGAKPGRDDAGRPVRARTGRTRTGRTSTGRTRTGRTEVGLQHDERALDGRTPTGRTDAAQGGSR